LGEGPPIPAASNGLTTANLAQASDPRNHLGSTLNDRGRLTCDPQVSKALLWLGENGELAPKLCHHELAQRLKAQLGVGSQCLGAAKLRVEQSIGPAHSDQLAIGPLFVNLVAVSAAPYGDALRLLPGGGIEVIRYPAT
jgi:hypothetical protein